MCRREADAAAAAELAAELKILQFEAALPRDRLRLLDFQRSMATTRQLPPYRQTQEGLLHQPPPQSSSFGVLIS